MRAFWHDLWGCGRGPAARLAPQTRLLAGAAALAAAMLAPPVDLRGMLVIAGASGSWLAACRPPLRVVRRVMALGTAVLLPYGVLLALAWALAPGAGGAPTSWRQALTVAWSVLARGLAAVLVSLATAASLSGSDLRDGLARLPVPRVASSILLQMLHQSATLAQETRKIVSALELRGASSRATAAWRLLASLPRVWLPRVMGRAERVAAAMELRGICEHEAQPLRAVRMGLFDAAVLASAAGVLALAVATRLGSAP